MHNGGRMHNSGRAQRRRTQRGEMNTKKKEKEAAATRIQSRARGRIGRKKAKLHGEQMQAATRIEAPATGGALITIGATRALVTASPDGTPLVASAPADACGVAVTMANAAAVVGGSLMTKALALCIAAQIAANSHGTLQA